MALLLLLGCSSPPPPPKTVAEAEPQVVEDLPTWCGGDNKPCVPTRDFASRLCRGQFAGAALFLFQKQSPWQRRWVNAKAGLPAKNAEGGPAGGALPHAEELLVMAVDEPAATNVDKKVKAAKKPEPDVLALRWDGTCVSLKGSDAVTYQAGNPKHPFVDWTKLDLFVQRSLLRDTEIQRDVSTQEKACTEKPSPECQKSVEALSNTIVTRIRRGVKLSMPEQRP
jgi:hypothetical protein